MAGTVGTILDPVAGTVGTILDPVAGTVGTILDPVAGTVGTILDPVADTVGTILEPVADTVGTILEPVGDVLGPVTGGGTVIHRLGENTAAVIHPGAGTGDAVAETLAPQTPAGIATTSGEVAAGSAPSAAASAIAPSPIAAATTAAGIITGLAALVVAFSSALIASESSRAPPRRFASEASSEFMPLLNPSLSATPKQLASVPGELSTSPSGARAAHRLRRPGQPRRRRHERRCFPGPSLRPRTFSAGLYGSPRDRPVRLAVGGDRRASRAPWLGPRPSRRRRAPTGARRRTT